MCFLRIKPLTVSHGGQKESNRVKVMLEPPPPPRFPRKDDLAGAVGFFGKAILGAEVPAPGFSAAPRREAAQFGVRLLGWMELERLSGCGCQNK